MSKPRKLNTRQLALDAMLAALCAVLGYLNLDFLNFSVSFASLPVLMAALLFGAPDGVLVGGVGTLLYQLLRYGVSVTTPLWILPYLVCGLAVGAFARRRGFALAPRETVAAVAAGELLVTLLNTPAIYVDSRIYGYYYPGIVTGMLLLRLALCVAKSLVFGAVLPGVLAPIQKAVCRREG